MYKTYIRKYLMVKNKNKYFGLLNKCFISLLNFSVSLVSKYGSLNNEPFVTRPTFTRLSLIELSYDPLVTSPDRRNENCNSFYHSSPKICSK